MQNAKCKKETIPPRVVIMRGLVGYPTTFKLQYFGRMFDGIS